MKDSTFKQSVVALDTNAFITLSRLDENFNSKHGQNFGFRQACRDIKRMAANGHVKFIITPMVYHELQQGWEKAGVTYEKEQEFLKRFCFVYKPKDEKDYARKVTSLAYHYVHNGAMRAEDKTKPMKDAIIMAEASVLGVSLITNNVKDFTNYDRSRKQKDGKRMEDIRRINDLRNYSYFIDSEKFTPAPYTSHQFLQVFRSNCFAPHDELSSALKSSEARGKIQNPSELCL